LEHTFYRRDHGFAIRNIRIGRALVHTSIQGHDVCTIESLNTDTHGINCGGEKVCSSNGKEHCILGRPWTRHLRMRSRSLAYLVRIRSFAPDNVRSRNGPPHRKLRLRLPYIYANLHMLPDREESVRSLATYEKAWKEVQISISLVSRTEARYRWKAYLTEYRSASRTAN
jgi:hypothetical protein